MSKQTFKIIGMHCASCATMIDLDLEDLPGIKSSKTNYAKQETTVEFDPLKITSIQIISSIQKSGYSVKMD